MIKKGIGATMRNSIEDLAGWAQVERPDLARLTADDNVVIVFSDIEGSTEHNEKMGDRGWVKLLERHNELIYKQVEAHGGHIVKSQGDGFMIVFSDPGQAVRCAIAVQRALQENPDRWDDIRVGIGVHMGTFVRRGDALFGRNVAMAARVAGRPTVGRSSSAIRCATRSKDCPISSSAHPARSNSKAYATAMLSIQSSYLVDHHGLTGTTGTPRRHVAPLPPIASKEFL